MKLIAGVLITAVLLSGCGNNSAEINQAKTDACKSIMFKGKNGIKGAWVHLHSDEQTGAFNNLVKLDKKYTEIAENVNESYLIAMSQVSSEGIADEIASNLMPRYRELIAKINVFCGAL